MSKTDSFFLGVLVSVIVALIILIVTDDGGYQQGQIDALTGKVKYQLVTNPDSTRVWKEIN